MAVESPENRQVPQAEQNRQKHHILEIGPHEHEWQSVGLEGGVHYQECKLCRTRRVESGNFEIATRKSWLRGLEEWDQTAIYEGQRLVEGEDARFLPRRRGRPPNPYKGK